MNNILEMIKNEKVEWKKLGEIAVVSGAGVDKKIKENEKVIKLLNYMDVYKNLYINSDIPQMKVTASDKKIKDCDIKYGDIFITPSSETKEDIFMSSVAIENFEKTVYSYHIMRIRLKEKNFITSCFLNYIFRSIEFRKKMQKKVFGNTRQTITKTEIEKLEVPIPSLKTQEKIVEILDSFVKYSTELQAELQNRTKQYEYYRDLLLSEEYLNKLSESPEIIGGGYAKLRIYNIEDITKIKNGKDWKKLNSGDIPVYGSGGYMNVSVDKYVYNKPTVLIPRKGSIENIFYLDKPFWNVDTIFYTEIDETKIIPKYFYYFMKTLDLKSLSTNSTRPSLTQTVLNKVKIKLPSLEIQNKVVEVLDRFQDLISNAEGLLPVEIEQRQKQYEYYREKLLTFENNMVQVKSSSTL
ncbi:restriction endonuclease subunit S [Anaerococcus vaginalis]|uniref:restriction endonuclease subunit S n=1 Tax=Anaerococcus vaginalis TaxID=33037 RepID=UPI002431F69D|nr:restriction endonuclease subunit S [Anaerococcus vaginalis]MDU5988560.1 restriction endonuclease subunit S [Anaerococcus vaginalis]